jgi:hypothetical protein
VITTSVEDLDRLYEIQGAWRNLIHESTSPWIFSLPEWSIAYLKTFGADCGLKLALAWDDDELIGVMPLVEKRGKAFELFLTRYEPISGSRADYQAPIIKSGAEHYLVPLFFEHLFHNQKRLLHWPSLPENHPVLPFFRRYFSLRGWPWSESLCFCPRYVLPPAYPEIEKTWSRNHREHVRRKRNRLHKMGRVTLEVVRDYEEIEDWLSEFFEVYSYKWRSEGLPSQFDNVRMRIYYRELVKQFVSNGLHVSSLKLDNKRLAYHFGFLHGGWLYWYTPTYRKEFHQYSPGVVHLSMLMEYGCSEKWLGIDFLQGDESYKRKWTSERLTCVTLNVGINGGGFPYQWVVNYEPKLRKVFGPYYTRLRFLLKGSEWV